PFEFRLPVRLKFTVPVKSPRFANARALGTSPDTTAPDPVNSINSDVDALLSADRKDGSSCIGFAPTVSNLPAVSSSLLSTESFAAAVPSNAAMIAFVGTSLSMLPRFANAADPNSPVVIGSSIHTAAPSVASVQRKIAPVVVLNQ